MEPFEPPATKPNVPEWWAKYLRLASAGVKKKVIIEDHLKIPRSTFFLTLKRFKAGYYLESPEKSA